MNYFTLILSVFIIFYLFILISTYLFQRSLLYHPGENNYFGDQLIVKIEKVKPTATKIKKIDDKELQKQKKQEPRIFEETEQESVEKPLVLKDQEKPLVLTNEVVEKKKFNK